MVVLPIAIAGPISETRPSSGCSSGHARPITPHVTYHLWRELGLGTGEAAQDVFRAPWPTADESALKQDEIELVLQINGKTRGAIRVPSEATKEQIEQLATSSPLAQKYVEGKPLKKVVVVPGRLVNIVL